MRFEQIAIIFYRIHNVVQHVSRGALRLEDGLANDVGVVGVEFPGSGGLAVAHLHHRLVALLHRLVGRLLLERDLRKGNSRYKSLACIPILYLAFITTNATLPMAHGFWYVRGLVKF